MGHVGFLGAGSTLLVVLTLSALTLPAQSPPGPGAERKGKLSEPLLGDRKAAEKVIRKTYQDDYSRRTPEALRALSAKLLGKARESKSSPTQCYALLVEARDLALAVPDARLALDAVEEIAGLFEVNRVEMRKAALAEAARSVKTPEAARSVAAGYLDFLRDALAGGDYEWAKKVLASASTLSRTARDPALSAGIQELGIDLAEAQKRWPAARSAEKSLAERPDDREANLTSGKFLCLAKDDWASGLKRLEKGSDAALARLAHEDLLDPKDAAARFSLGNAWWSFAEKRSGVEGLVLRLRGAFWLARAMEDIDPVRRDAVLARLEAFLPEVPTTRLAWHGVEAPPGFAVARLNGKDQRGWVVLDGAWKFSSLLSSDARNAKDDANRYLRSSVKARWVQVHFEFMGGNPGLYLSSEPDATRGVGANLGSDGKWNEIKVDVDMNRWNTVRFQRTGDSMKVYLNDRLCHSFFPPPASFVLVKAQRGELRVRRLFAFGSNP